ncbi:reverse transcriptase domain-containing protein [Tanacetum coccineum]
MPTWCHMLNSTLIGAARVWFDELPPKSIDSYKDLKAAFLAYFMQQKKHVKDPVEIHNIKQRDGEMIEEFMERFKVETGRMKGAPECMKISGFMHRVNNHELTKRLNERVPKTLEEMMTTTTAFIRGETIAASKKKVHTPWKPQYQTKRHTSEPRFDFRNQPRDGQGSNKFTPLNRTPKEILPLRRRRQMGNRHCGSFSGRTWEGQVLDSLHGLLYKMKRSKGRSNHQWWSSKEVCMGQYSVSLWASGRDRSKGGGNHQWRSSKKDCLGQYSVSLWASGRDSF